MITSWADEEDKANAKYDAIRGKSKQNMGGNNNNNNNNNNNGNQGGRNSNYSGPNRKRKPDNTVAAMVSFIGRKSPIFPKFPIYP
jgi:hypothetical protein